MTLSIKCSKIESEKSIKFIVGYTWATNKLTKLEFEKQRQHDTGFKVSGICLDLIDDNQDIKDTITITQERFDKIRNKELKEEN